MERLEARLTQALLGEGGICLLAGEAGIGKTRCAEELTARASLHGVDTWCGRSVEGLGAPVFWPWIQVLREAVRARPALRESGEALLSRMAAEGERENGAPREPRRKAGDRFWVLDGVVRLLVQAAEEAPILLLLEDLHWADSATLELLALLVAPAPAPDPARRRHVARRTSPSRTAAAPPACCGSAAAHRARPSDPRRRRLVHRRADAPRALHLALQGRPSRDGRQPALPPGDGALAAARAWRGAPAPTSSPRRSARRRSRATCCARGSRRSTPRRSPCWRVPPCSARASRSRSCSACRRGSFESLLEALERASALRPGRRGRLAPLPLRARTAALDPLRRHARPRSRRHAPSRGGAARAARRRGATPQPDRAPLLPLAAGRRLCAGRFGGRGRRRSGRRHAGLRGRDRLLRLGARGAGLDPATPTRQRAELLFALGRAERLAGRYDDSRRTLSIVVEIGRQQGYSDLLLRAARIAAPFASGRRRSRPARALDARRGAARRAGRSGPAAHQRAEPARLRAALRARHAAERCPLRGGGRARAPARRLGASLRGAARAPARALRARSTSTT